MVHLLLEHKASVDLQDAEGRTALMGAGECFWAVHVDGDTNQLVVEHNSVRAAFNFDRCFGQDSSQEHVFDEVRARVLRSCALACGCACI